MVGWLTGWLAGCLAGWLVEWFAEWSAGAIQMISLKIVEATFCSIELRSVGFCVVCWFMPSAFVS